MIDHVAKIARSAFRYNNRFNHDILETAIERCSRNEKPYWLLSW